MPIWANFEDPWIIDIFYGNMEYFTDTWDILRTFGIFYDH
jgi:hypothetical protein